MNVRQRHAQNHGRIKHVENDTLAKIDQVKVPLLVIHGTEDEIVPFDMGRRVFERAKGTKRFYSVEGANHNDVTTVGGDEYFYRWKKFLKDLTPPLQSNLP